MLGAIISRNKLSITLFLYCFVIISLWHVVTSLSHLGHICHLLNASIQLWPCKQWSRSVFDGLLCKNPYSEYGYGSSYQKKHLKIVPVTKEYYSILNYIFQLAPFGIKLGYFFSTNHFLKTIQQLYKNYSKLQAEYRKRLNPGTNSDLGWIRGSVYNE